MLKQIIDHSQKSIYAQYLTALMSIITPLSNSKTSNETPPVIQNDQFNKKHYQSKISVNSRPKYIKAKVTATN